VFEDPIEKKLKTATNYSRFFRKMSSHFEGEEERIKDRILEYLKQGRNPPAVLPVFWKRNTIAKRVYESLAESMEIIKDELKHQSRMRELMKDSNVKLNTRKDIQRLNKIFSGFVKDIEVQGDVMERFLEQMRMDFLEPLIDVSKILDEQVRQQDKLTERTMGSDISKELLGEFLEDLKSNDKERYQEIQDFLDSIEV